MTFEADASTERPKEHRVKECWVAVKEFVSIYPYYGCIVNKIDMEVDVDVAVEVGCC